MKSNKKVRVCSVFFSLIMVFSMIIPMSVFAYDVAISGDIGDANIKKVFGSMMNSNSENGVDAFDVTVDGQTSHLFSVENNIFTINSAVWNKLDNAKKVEYMGDFVDKMAEIDGIDENALNEFMTDIQESDNSVGTIMLPLIFKSTRADLYGAYKAVKPFLDIFSWILGIGAVALIIILLGSTVLDLAYIGLPVWREAQAGKEGGNGKHPFGVSYEALRTVNEIEQGFGGSGGGEYKNGYLLYLKRRALTYIILAVCIMYLICGGLSGVIAWVLSLTTGLVG